MMIDTKTQINVGNKDIRILGHIIKGWRVEKGQGVKQYSGTNEL